MYLRLGAVKAIWDLPFFVTILFLNILPHGTKVGGKVVKVTGQACGSHRCCLTMSGRRLERSGRWVNRGTRLEDRGVSRKIGGSRLRDGQGSRARKCVSSKWRCLDRRGRRLQVSEVSEDSLYRRQSIA